jgi:hypothetical protein
MNITYDISSFVDIDRLCNDNEYAKKLGVVVKSRKNPKVKNIEKELRNIDNNDPDWREKVMTLKAQMTKAKEEPKIYLIKYKKDYLNVNNRETLGLLRSVILYNGEIMSFAPPKSLDYETYIEKTGDDVNSNSLEEYVEGTMINLFFNKLTQEWEIASRSNIGARCSFYQDKKTTFRSMFLEAMNLLGYEFSDFNQKYCYSWILQHPDNRIVVPFTRPNIVLCKVYECNGLVVNEVSSEWNYETPRPLSKVIDCTGMCPTQIKDEFESGAYNYKIMGAVFTNPETGIRTKVRNPNYEYVRKLKGNSPKLQYQYYTLRQMGAVGDFLKYYPEHKHTFETFRKQIHAFTHNLHANYIRCYINKEKPLREFPFEYRTHMYNLHKLYLDELRERRESVRKYVVVNYINNIPCDHLMSSINYPLKKQNVDEIKSVVNDIIDTAVENSV